jgi:VWFA-related protein
LKESDFEVFVDGKKQSITYFRLVKLGLPVQPIPSEDKKAGNNAIAPMPSGALKQLEPEQVHRTIALVVDDLGLSFSSTDAVRSALKKFVNTQVQDNDLVAIIQTGKGLGALQQFTSDKRILLAAIDKLRWNPISRDMMPQFGEQPATARDGAFSEYSQDFRETVFTVGTLGAVNFVVRGLRELPGRKMVVLLSDGFRLFGRGHDNPQALENMRRLTDLANRSSVVIYTIDARGLVVVARDASYDGGAKNLQQSLDEEGKQNQLFADSQDGLITLARNTGGFAAINSNDLNLGIQRVLQDNQSYYLLGFDPDDEQFSQKYQNKFHAIKIKVNRPGLEVRTRSGYFGVPENLAHEAPKTREQQILHALFSPFGVKELSIQMTSQFFSTEPGKSFVRSFLRIAPEKLTFVDLPTGERELMLDVAAFTFDENGRAIERNGKVYTLKLNKIQHESVMKTGLAYEHNTPIQKPGAYQFRMVLRDVHSETLGSAGQFIRVPDLGKNQLALSGIALVGKQNPGSGSAESSADASAANATVRRFARNARLEYWLQIYNSQLERATQTPKVTVQSEVYRDGKAIFQSAAQQVPSTGQTDLKRLICGGEVQLANLPPGEYLLHIIVRDPLANAKYAAADQWIDFSVQ